ncbi:MAG: hypothetical protein K0R25_673 [Rickettsiaceae bacterium]|jgi:hypothetical protein|nr:hypothetical protein [Rickettsiaceae bacterium]
MNKISIYLLALFCLIFVSCTTTKTISPLFDANSAEHDERIKDLLLSQYPEAPKGFKWIMFQGVALRKPIAWSEYKTDKVYTSSVESVSKKGKFETGITIQRIRNVRKINHIEAIEYAVAYLKIFEADKNNKTLIRTFGGTKDYGAIVYRYRNAPSNLKPIIVHKFLIANDNEDSVVIVTLEAPEKTWDKIWERYGLVIFKQVSANPYEAS